MIFNSKSRLISLETLLCANNRINILGNLSFSFPNLKSLVLSSNNLTLLESLIPLSQLKFLETLICLDNPVSHKEHYKDYIISLIPNLRVLNFQKITSKDRRNASRKFPNILPTNTPSPGSMFKFKLRQLVQSISSLEEANFIEGKIKNGEMTEEMLDKLLKQRFN